MKLSIIIPYYNALENIKKLFEVLEPQLDKDVEVIIVDDGCNEKELDKLNAKVFHIENNSGGASKPRNIGLDNAKGKYIAFIDADDMITDDYISLIKEKIKEDKDIIYLSWKSDKHNVVIKDKPPLWNHTVCSKEYKKDLIKNIRFDEKTNFAEDKYFNDKIKPKTSSKIEKQIYIYNARVPESLSKRGAKKVVGIVFLFIGIHYTILGIIILLFVLLKYFKII